MCDEVLWENLSHDQKKIFSSNCLRKKWANYSYVLLIFYFEINRVPHVSSYLSNQKEFLYDEDEGKYFFNKGNNKSLKNKWF